MGYQTIKSQQLTEVHELVMVKSVSMSYFSKSGKARLGTKTTYDCIIQDAEQETIQGLYNMTSKREANKAFKELLATAQEAAAEVLQELKK